MTEPTYTAVKLPIDPPGLTVGVAIDGNGVTYIANRQADQLQRFVADGPLETLDATGLGDPYGLKIDADGRVVVADYGRHRVVRFDPATGAQEDLPFTGLRHPSDVEIDSQGRILAVDSGNQRVVRLEPATGVQTTLGTGQLWGVHAIALAADDTIYVTVKGSGPEGLHRYGADGEPVRIAMLDGATGIAVGQDGVVHVGSMNLSSVTRYRPDGTKLSTVKTFVPLADDPEVMRPVGLALDAADNITVFGYQSEAIKLIRN